MPDPEVQKNYQKRLKLSKTIGKIVKGCLTELPCVTKYYKMSVLNISCN